MNASEIKMMLNMADDNMPVVVRDNLDVNDYWQVDTVSLFRATEISKRRYKYDPKGDIKVISIGLMDEADLEAIEAARRDSDSSS